MSAKDNPHTKTGRTGTGGGLELAIPRVTVRARPDGGWLVQSADPLGPCARAVPDWLFGWSRARPDGVWIAERDDDDGWRRLRYGEAAEQVRRVAHALLDRGLGPERPVMILAENSIAQAVLTMGCYVAGVPVAPVSMAYATLSRDFVKLRAVVDQIRPALLFVEDKAACADALAVLELSQVEVVFAGLERLSADGAGAAVDSAYAGIGPDTCAKILFTSGSTGSPKGVLNTHRMMTSNQQALAQIMPFLESRPPVLVDWLPWNHTFGGNHNFNLVLRTGGTLYIDGGKPAPGLIDRTVDNLREISPSLYFSVPRGFDMLLPYLETDAELRSRFFARLDMLFYAGAALPKSLWERLEALAVAERGAGVFMSSAWGATETAPMVTCIHYEVHRPGNIGLPAPGAELKLIPSGDGLEMRVRGPGVTPGYWRAPELTRAAFDDEGFLLTGDGGRFADPSDPSRGLVFDGRVAENFKLQTAVWVHVGQVRLAVIAACSPVLQDAVVVGEDRSEIGLIAFLNLAGARRIAGTAGASPAELLDNQTLRLYIADRLGVHNKNNTGSSVRIGRVLLSDEPLSIDAGEITDKGYINQRAARRRRAATIGRLYDGSDPTVIRVQ